MANLNLHLYAPTSVSYSPDKFVNYLRGFVPDDPDRKEPPVDRFDAAGVNLVFYSNVAHATADFTKSLLDDGSVVVYLGHGVPDPKCKCSRGLSWLGHGIADIPAITVAKPGQRKPPDLMDLVRGSRAKLVVLATCASSTFGLEKLKTGPAVVVTNSGSDLVTYSAKWGIALQHFLLLLIGYRVNYQTGQPYLPPPPPTTLMAGAVGAPFPVAVASKLVTPRGSIRQAVDAANEAFKANKTTDRCELAHGEGSMVVFP